MRVTVGVSGGIAAYKAAELVRALQRQGFNLVHWREGGMCYWAVSDLNEADLRAFAQLVSAANRSPPRWQGRPLSDRGRFAAIQVR